MANKKQSIFRRFVNFVKTKPVVALALVALVAGSVSMLSASAQSGDCGDNSIVECGAYNGSSSTPSFAILKGRLTSEHYSIYSTVTGQNVNASNLNEGDFKRGYVDSANNVHVYADQSKWWDDNNSSVSSNAWSFGRKSIGSSAPVKINDSLTIYKRHPAESFGTGGLKSWVKLDVNGNFQYAIIAVCGNPVIPNTPPPPTNPNISIRKYVGSVTNPSTVYQDANTTPITVGAGDTITYDIKIKNTGNADATGLVFGDQVENNIGAAVDISTLQLTGGTTVPGAKIVTRDGKKWIVSDPFTLRAGDTKDVEFTVRVKSGYSGTFDNIGCVSASQTSLPICDNARVVVDPTPTYSCTNLSVQKLSRTSFKFVVSGSASHTSITGYRITINGAEVHNGTANSYTRTQTTPGTYTVKAYVKTALGTTGDTAVCTKTFTVTPPPATPEYTIKKYVNTNDAQNNESAVTVAPNQEFEYKVVIANTGSVTINSIKAWDTLPAGVTYVDNTLKLNGQTISNDSDYFDSTKGVEVENLAAGQEAVFTFKAKIVAESDEDKAEACTPTGTFYNNVAHADPAQQGTGESSSNLPEESDPAVIKCRYTPPVENPSVDIQKDVSQYNVAVGEEFNWIIKVTNNGDIDLRNVRVTDTAPANTEFISSEQVEGAPSTITENKEFSATIADLSVGEVVEFVIKAKVTQYQEGEITNTACVDAPEVNPDDLNSSDDCDDARVRPEIEKCPVPGKEDMNKDSADCYEPCVIPGKENLKSTDPACDKVGKYTPPTSETPSTGAGGAAILAVIVAVISGFAYFQVYKSSKKAAKS